MIRADGFTLEVGDSFALEIKAIISGYTGPKFHTENTDIAEVSQGGSVLALSPGTATIEAEITKGENVYQATSTIKVVDSLDYGLTPARTATGIALARVPTAIEIGEEFAAQAYLLSEMNDDHPWPYCYSDDNLVKFTSSNPEICRVKNGVLIGVSTGVATITASDLTGNVSTTFDVEVVEKIGLEYTDAEVLEIKAEDYDWTTTESTTLAIIGILAEASTAGMKKVVFPNRLYNVSPAYGSFKVPSHMILDFSNSVIQIEPSTLTTAGGYQMFLFNNTEYSSIENAVVYGERDLIEGTGVEGCESVKFSGANLRSGLKNCTFSKSPGFNVGASWGGLVRVGCHLAAIEEGGIDENGQDVEETYAYRCSEYMNLSSIGSRFGFGNMQGYQGYLYLSARVYSIYFYDANKNFLSSIQNCIQYYLYDKPEGAMYARIKFWQGFKPNSCDPDFASIAHLYSAGVPDRCYIRNCLFEDNYSSAIQPNGGGTFYISDCKFKNNGYRDPAAHIDWEDGRNHNKGHVLRNCTFEGGGQVIATGSDGLVVHNNNFVDITSFRIGSEAQNNRIWLNRFEECNVFIYNKTDMVFSQNIGYDANLTVGNTEGVAFAIHEIANQFE